MCGIVGLMKGSSGRRDPSLTYLLQQMTPRLAHRGPDDQGIWDDSDVGVGLGHCRLAILDLSHAGHQPMTSPTGRFVISYNGEVYNFRTLRESLAKLGHRFKGQSDTEVLMAGVEQWGLDELLDRASGMFAFAIWDRESRKLALARDRIGEKPLYFGAVGGDFVFASELKALSAHPKWSGEIDRNAVALFMKRGFVPAPHSIYRGIFKLMPGQILEIPNGFNTTSASYRHFESLIRTYWSAREVVEEATRTPFESNESAAVAQLDTLLRNVVGDHMLSDVPVGAFLSGGIDSSTIVSLMQSISSRPVRTFTIGFSETEFDEAREAKAVADHLGTEHTEMYVSPREAREVIPTLPTVYDEPFADSSQIPTLIVSRLARQGVTVALTGDGGDELFGGYNRYVWGKRAQRMVRLVPGPLRKAVGAALSVPSTAAWTRFYQAVAPVLPSSLKVRTAGDKIHTLAKVMRMRNLNDFYSGLVENGGWPDSVVLGSEPSAAVSRRATGNFSDYALQMMFFDLIGYLPDDILTKVDRATMATGLEARAPFLDRRVVEHAWRIPLSMKLRDGRGKWILSKVLEQYVPAHLVDRPKSGFGVPVGAWLRGPLRDWAEHLLNENDLDNDGLLDTKFVRDRWAAHLSGKGNWHLDLWSVLMLRSWMTENPART